MKSILIIIQFWCKPVYIFHRLETGLYEELKSGIGGFDQYGSLNVSLDDRHNRYQFTINLSLYGVSSFFLLSFYSV